MKKLILLLLISLTGYSQITISGSSNSDLNTTFTLNNTAPGINAAWCMNPNFLHDSGTNIYQAPTLAPNEFLYVIRRNGYWYVERNYDYGNAWRVYYRTALPSTEVDPPCNATWEIWDGVCFSYGNSNAFTGNTTNSLMLSGSSCTSPSTVTSTTICPNVINLPQQTTAQIAAITSPHQGMMTYDINQNCIKFYNGVEWVCIYNNMGQVASNGNVTVPITGKMIFGQNGQGETDFIRNYNLYNSTGLNFFTNNLSRMLISQNGNVKINSLNIAGNSTFEVNGSQGIKTKTWSADLNLDENMHTLIYTGVGGNTFTLPIGPVFDREYYILNHGQGNLQLSPTVLTGYATTLSQLLPGESVHVVFVSGDWRKIN